MLDKIIKKKWVIIPIEIKKREFESRLLLALELINSDFGVIIGSQNNITKNIQKFSNMFYFDKSLSQNKISFFNKMKKNNITILSIDEEGIGSINNKMTYVNQRISDETLDICEKMFVWGEFEKDLIISEHPKYKDKIIVSGNPRIDLWKSQFFQQLYKNNIIYNNNVYGNYLFFPSSFGIKHVKGKEFLFNQAKNYKVFTNEEEEKDYIKFSDNHEKVFYLYVELIKDVSKQYNNKIIIVRPHPSEDVKWWENSFSNYDNVRIITNGPVAQWIIGAEAVIHSSCTTGIESFLLGKPTISFLPDNDYEYSKHLSNKCSFCTINNDEVISQIKSNYAGFFENYEFYKIELSKYFPNITQFDSYKAIVENIRKIKIEKNDFDLGVYSKSYIKINIAKYKNYIYHKLINLINPIYKRRLNTIYQNQKFDFLTKNEIEENIKVLYSSGLVDRKTNYHINELYENVFSIHY